MRRNSSDTRLADRDREAQRQEVGLDAFTVHGLVGEGAFGKVMMATKIDTGKVYAMKVIRKVLLLTKGDHSVSQAITEKQVLQQMASRPHPFVVSLRFASANRPSPPRPLPFILSPPPPRLTLTPAI